MVTTVSKNGSYHFELKSRNRSIPGTWSAYSYGGVLDFLTSTVLTKGDALPDYKARIRNLQSATTALDCLESSCKNFSYGYAYSRRASMFGAERECEMVGSIAQTNIGPDDPSNYIIVPVKNQTIVRVNQAIRAAQTDLQGLVAAGEFGETLRMVNGAGRELMHGMRSYLSDCDRLIKYANPRNLLRSISRRWLELSFGWKPLVSDIDSGLNALNTFRAGRMPIIHIREQAKSAEMNQPTRLTQDIEDFHIERLVTKTFRYECKIYGVVGLSDDQLLTTNNLGINLSEVVPTIWELIPYSFLADYFVNIGAVIDAYSINKSGVKWLNLGELRACDVVMTPLVTPRTFSGWKTTAFHVSAGEPIRRSRVRKSRGVFSVGSLIPELEFKIPGSSTRWCNVAALAFQHLDTSKRLRRALSRL